MGVEPPVGSADSQAPPSVVEVVVVNATEAPLLVTWNVCGGGTASLADVNVSELGLTVMVLPPAPAEVNVNTLLYNDPPLIAAMFITTLPTSVAGGVQVKVHDEPLPDCRMNCIPVASVAISLPLPAVKLPACALVLCAIDDNSNPPAPELSATVKDIAGPPGVYVVPEGNVTVTPLLPELVVP